MTDLAEAAWKKCQEGNHALYKHGDWCDWPCGAQEEPVLDFLKSHLEKFLEFARKEKQAVPNSQRRILSQPDFPVAGSAAKRKLDVGFTDGPGSDEDGRYTWVHIRKSFHIGGALVEGSVPMR